MTDKRKQKIRDIQDQSGWSYSFCMFLVDNLTYAVVSEALDKLPKREPLNADQWDLLGKVLNQRAKMAKNTKGDR